MITILLSLGVAILMAGFAMHKGRTGWHWFLLTLVAYIAVWAVSMAGLYLANLRVSVSNHDLAIFTAAITLTVIVVILLCVPARTRKHRPGWSGSEDRAGGDLRS